MKDTTNVDQQTIIITGASRGLGAATARIAAELGANVVLAARSYDQLQIEVQIIREAGGQALALRADVSQEEDCQAIIRQTVERFGRIDALVNNSGVVEPIAFIAQADLQEWHTNWVVNVLGPIRLVQMALPYLRSHQGRVINITSGAAVNVIGGWSAYSSAKAAINHLTKILASEEPELTVIALRPGIVDTTMQTAIRKKGKAHMAEENYERLFGLHQQGKLLPAEQPGRAIACLALFAPDTWSGEVLQWDEARVQQLVEASQPARHQ